MTALFALAVFSTFIFVTLSMHSSRISREEEKSCPCYSCDCESECRGSRKDTCPRWENVKCT